MSNVVGVPHSFVQNSPEGNSDTGESPRQWREDMPFRTKRRVVLLADDEVLIRNLVRLSLEDAGFQVLSAADGLEALALSRNYPEKIDVLLTDIDMPNLDGISLTERIRTERPDIKVLFMSGRLSSPVCIDAVEVKLLPKPFSPQGLVQMIRGLFLGAML